MTDLWGFTKWAHGKLLDGGWEEVDNYGVLRHPIKSQVLSFVSRNSVRLRPSEFSDIVEFVVSLDDIHGTMFMIFYHGEKTTKYKLEDFNVLKPKLDLKEIPFAGKNELRVIFEEKYPELFHTMDQSKFQSAFLEFLEYVNTQPTE